MRFFKMAVAIDPQHHGFKPFNRSQRCRLQSFTEFDYNILQLNHTNLARSLKQAFEVDSIIHRSFSTPCFSLNEQDLDDDDDNIYPKFEIVGGRGTPKVRSFVVELAISLTSGVDLSPLQSGLGGAYLLCSRNRRSNIAVAKPIDEEPLAFNNPKGFGGLMLGQPGMKRSIRVGETGIRELAAYLLDHEGFAGVPPTALVKIANVGFHVNDASTFSTPPSKIASVQRFVEHDFDAGELGPSGFSVASVHRIGILDVRILNLDRHAGNILVRKNDQINGNYAVGVAELVPIDHGLCLPEWLEDPYFEWLHWPQAAVPFSESEFEYIANLDPFKDAELLRKELPSLRESAIRVLILCTIFLKEAAASCLCLAEIGELMTREFHGGEENFSVLEGLCAKTKATMANLSNVEHDQDQNNKQNEQESEEFEMFHFDIETEDNNCNDDDAVDLPHLFQSPPQKLNIPDFTSVKTMATLSPLYGANDHDNFRHDSCETNINNDHDDDDNREDESKGCGLTRSISCYYNFEKTTEVSVGDMSEGEWELFLECFKKLLPEVFEDIKCMGLKQRLGTSCKF